MQEVNAAWSVLGDPQARAAYDARLGLVVLGQPDDVEDDDEWPEPVPVRRTGPPSLRGLARQWLPLWILLGLLAAIFLFTAYAGTPPPS